MRKARFLTINVRKNLVITFGWWGLTKKGSNQFCSLSIEFRFCDSHSLKEKSRKRYYLNLKTWRYSMFATSRSLLSTLLLLHACMCLHIAIKSNRVCPCCDWFHTRQYSRKPHFSNRFVRRECVVRRAALIFVRQNRNTNLLIVLLARTF